MASGTPVYRVANFLNHQKGQFILTGVVSDKFIRNVDHGNTFTLCPIILIL